MESEFRQPHFIKLTLCIHRNSLENGLTERFQAELSFVVKTMLYSMGCELSCAYGKEQVFQLMNANPIMAIALWDAYLLRNKILMHFLDFTSKQSWT